MGAESFIANTWAAIQWGAILQTFLAAGCGTIIFEIIRDYCKHRRDRDAKGAYLAIRIAVLLEGFATNCAKLIQDNIRNRRQPESDGGIAIKTQLPKFPELPADDTEGWRALPRPLFSKVLGFESRVASAQEMVDFILESEGNLVEREIVSLVGKLGLDALNTAANLRSKFGAPKVELDWNYPDFLEVVVGIADHPNSHGVKLEPEGSFRSKVQQRIMRHLNLGKK
ncbi:hypothetical protein [Phyllobacterium sp. 22552]|uniref:hypothetical protein n=1 Tax=Phyllobacterium sp. 22552 TaxID=3453941 RepID=UPI003F84FE27